MRRIALGMLALLPASAAAVTIRVPADQATIRDGLAAAAPGDTVEVACGVYREYGLFLGTDAVVRSENGSPHCVVIDAAELGRCLSVIGSPVFEGITFANGKAYGDGGGVDCSRGSPTFDDCRFIGNVAIFRGGGLYLSAVSATLRNCQFSTNTCLTSPTGDGAGIYVNGGSADLDGCTFDGNFSWRHGGGIFASGADVSLDNCTFTGNTAQREGGAVSCSQGSIRMTACTIQENRGATYGGGLTLRGPVTATVRRTTFDGNRSSGGGGAFFGDPQMPITSTVLFDACIFTSNWSSSGGGLYATAPNPPRGGCTGPAVSVSECVFRENDAYNGGGVWMRTPTTIDRSRFDRNQADHGGAGLVSSCRTTFTLSTFTGNVTRGGNGGALSIPSGATITGSTFVGNGAAAPGHGGALWAAASGRVTMSETVIAYHGEGEPIFCDPGSIVTLSCTNVFGNQDGDWTACIASQRPQNGNLSVDPGFCDLPGGDFGVKPSSPLLPPGNSCGVLIGAHGQGCASLALTVVPETWGRLKARYR